MSSNHPNSGEDRTEKRTQAPSPDDTEAQPHRDRSNSKEPTATGPDSVAESVPEAAETAGKAHGPNPDAADPPLAAEHAELEPDEGADVFETRHEARKGQREAPTDRRDEQQITLDPPD